VARADGADGNHGGASLRQQDRLGKCVAGGAKELFACA